MNRREFFKMMFAASVSGLIPNEAASAAVTRATKLVLVHGRGQQGLNPDDLKKEWLQALNLGAAKSQLKLSAKVDVTFPFYGNVLDKYTKQLDIPLTSEVATRGTGPDDEFLRFQAEFADAIKDAAGVTNDQVLAEFGNDPSERGPLNWKWVQAILRAIDKHTAGLNQQAIETFTRDVFLYTTRAEVRREIDEIVAKTLTEEPTVVVGHSLGTVVAYSVLSTDLRPLKVPLFVTVGSPLAVRAVRDQFRPLKYPPPIAAWYNAFDKRDVVALYPLDEKNFRVQPPIENCDTVRNDTPNRHGISGYLNDPEVAKRVLNALGS